MPQRNDPSRLSIVHSSVLLFFPGIHSALGTSFRHRAFPRLADMPKPAPLALPAVPGKLPTPFSRRPKLRLAERSQQDVPLAEDERKPAPESEISQQQVCNISPLSSPGKLVPVCFEIPAGIYIHTKKFTFRRSTVERLTYYFI